MANKYMQGAQHPSRIRETCQNHNGNITSHLLDGYPQKDGEEQVLVRT